MGVGVLSIELSWPVPELSPNKRLHHAAKYRFVKQAREAAFWSTRQAMGAQWGPSVTRLEHDGKRDVLLRQIAHPPANYRYDRDGIDARLKHARDGIADALQVNDRFFRPTGIEWGDPVPGGKVIVTVGAST